MVIKLIHIKSQLKIIKRYSSLVFVGIMFYAISILVITLLSSKIRQHHLLSKVNFPLLIIIISVFSTAAMFADLFPGKMNEKRGYVLQLWSLRKVIISKNGASTLITLLFPLPFLVVLPFFFHTSFQDYLNAGLYLITTLPPYLIFGNMISFSRKGLQSTDDKSDILPYLLLLSICAPMPYLVLESGLKSSVFCLAFFILCIMIWYFYLLPRYEHQFIELLTKSDLL